MLKNVNPPETSLTSFFWRFNAMKLYLLFAVIDLIVLLIYPFVFIMHRIRKMMGVK